MPSKKTGPARTRRAPARWRKCSTKLTTGFDGVDGELPAELRSVADYPNVVARLQSRGYRDADIRKLLGGNLLRTWTAVEAGAGK